MAGSSSKKRYPPRLYRDGKSPIQKRSMNHNCQLSAFGNMKDCIGTPVYEDIRENYPVGVILKLADSPYLWNAKTVHHLLVNQLAIDRRYEMWCLIEGSPIRFSLYEYEEITGLNCDPIDVDDVVDVDHTEFWEAIHVDPQHGPNWKELDAALRLCRTWDYDLRKMIGLLYVIHVGILGLPRGTRIPLEQAKKVFDKEAFLRFPWGRVGFNRMIDSIKVVSFQNDSYVIHGCVHVLLIWAFESILALGKSHGGEIKGDSIPLISWTGGRKRYDVAQFLVTVKKKKKKVEVHHLVVKPESELFPFWPDEDGKYGEGEGGNRLLDNLLHDIMHGCVDQSAWDDASDYCVDKKNNEKLKKVVDDEDDFIDKPRKKKERFRSEKKRKGQKLNDVSNESDDDSGELRGRREVAAKGFESLDDVVQLLTALTTKVDGIGSKVDEMGRQIISMQDDVDKLKDGQIENKDKDAHSTTEEGWLLQMKQTSDEDHPPYSCVVRKPKSKVKQSVGRTTKTKPEELFKTPKPSDFFKFPKRAMSQKREDALKTSKPMEPSKPMDAFKSPEPVETFNSPKPTIKVLKSEPQLAGKKSSCLVDLTKDMKSTKPLAEKKISGLDDLTIDLKKPIPVPMAEKNKSSPIDLTNDMKHTTPVAKKNYKLSDLDDDREDALLKEFDGVLEKLMVVCQQDDFVPRKCRRRKNLASTQLDPFVGSSVVKRMLKGVVLSPAAYDPFEKVSSKKVDKLMAFIKDDLDNPLETSNDDANYYMRLMTPKEMWDPKDPKYGWLKDTHLCSIMIMLRQRSMRDVSPYLSTKIAFLDPWFVNQWAHDYKRFDKEKNWLFPPEYFNVYEGKGHRCGNTNKRWYHEIDTLYLIHNVNGDHWVACEIEFRRRRIKVYDSAYNSITDNVTESCKPYSRMIPLILNITAPPEMKQELGTAAYTIYRMKTMPQNKQSGDCGVYAVKYIECLAIGINFEGLCDAAMPAVRLKLAAELYDELPDTDCYMQMSDPNPRGDDTGGVEFISQANLF